VSKQPITIKAVFKYEIFYEIFNFMQFTDIN